MINYAVMVTSIIFLPGSGAIFILGFCDRPDEDVDDCSSTFISPKLQTCKIHSIKCY